MTSKEIKLLKFRIEILEQPNDMSDLFFGSELEQHLNNLKEDLKEAIHEKLTK